MPITGYRTIRLRIVPVSYFADLPDAQDVRDLVMGGRHPFIRIRI
ncbi:hypothetical protein [Propionivibrio sp.]|nr:hypothetical protein [Propionivibrio sp.]